MIVCTEDEIFSQLEKALKTTFQDTRTLQIFHSKDGYQGFTKVLMSHPDLVITEWELSTKYSGRKLIEDIFREPKIQNMSIVVIGDAPDGDIFVDQVVTGQLQFSPPPFDQVHFIRALAKAAQRNFGNTEFKLRVLAKDEVLFLEGDPAESSFLVKTGKLCAYKITNGKDEILGEIKVGEFVGEMAYISGEPRSASVKAMENSELVELPMTSLDSLIFSKPAWSKALMKTLSNRLKKSNTKKSG